MPNLRLQAARRMTKRAVSHRSRAYAERNELIGVLARLYPSHLMPASRGGLKTLTTRMVVCIHSPAGLLCWIVTEEEADTYFKPMARIDDNHWDLSTREDRSGRLAQLTALPPPGTAPAKAKRPRVAARRPGDFSRPRTRNSRG